MVSNHQSSESSSSPCGLILNDLVQKIARLPVVDRGPILEDIDRLQACLAECERAPLEADERFQILADSNPLLTWMTDARGENLYINRTYREFIGVTLEEVHGVKWQDYLHPEDAPGYPAAFFQAIREQKEFHGEARLRRTDGEWRWIATYAKPRFSVDGAFLGHMGYSMDITERKQAEEALRQAHERASWLARFPGENPNPVARVAENGAILYHNSAAANLPGWAFQVGQPLPDPLLPLVQQAMRLGQGVQEDVLLAGRFFSVWITPFPEEGYVNLYSQDITERKLAEERLAYQASLLEIIHDAIFAMDGQMKITFWNQAAERLYGWTAEEALGQDAAAFLRSELIGEERVRVLKQSIETGTFQGEVVHHTKDGRRIVIEARMMVQKDASGQPTRYLTANRDITDRKEAEAALIAYAEALRMSQKREQARSIELEILMDAMPTLIWISHDTDCRVITGNRYGHEFLGLGPEANLSKTAPAWDLALQKYQYMKDGRPVPVAELPMQITASTGKPARDFTLDVVFEGGKVAHLLGNVNPLLDADGKPAGAIGAFMDITELRRLEKEQREHATQMEIQQRLLEYREKERQIIARDLHDGPVQDLSGLIFQIQFTKEAISDPGIKVEFDHIGLALKGAVQNLRELMNELRPPSLIRFGLAKALMVYLEEFKEKHPEIEVETDFINDQDCLSEQARLNLYRILQEALNNALKHSNATRLSIQLICSDDQVVFEIGDNGNGFTISNDFIDYTRSNHFGLVGMRERAEAIGGTFHISAGPNQGTKIVITVPVQK